MRAMRRAATATGLLIMAFLPVAAAVSAEPSSQTQVPVAIAQPLGAISPELVAGDTPILPESGLIMLVGTGLMGLAAIVRRVTKSQATGTTDRTL
jgi:hypothetical protein